MKLIAAWVLGMAAQAVVRRLDDRRRGIPFRLRRFLSSKVIALALMEAWRLEMSHVPWLHLIPRTALAAFVGGYASDLAATYLIRKLAAHGVIEAKNNLNHIDATKGE